MPAAAKAKYHHGDLRRDLLQVAREEIALHGAHGVSLASLARLARVSQPAPYRHFADRGALLESVAAEAFQAFTRSLVDAMASRPPVEALAFLASAYVTFGEANTEIYRLMFASRLTPQAATGGELDSASNASFDVLRTAVAAAYPTNGSDDIAFSIWAQLHGLVMLKADGFIKSSLGRLIVLPRANDDCRGRVAGSGG